MISQKPGRLALLVAGAVAMVEGLAVLGLGVADLLHLDSAHTGLGIGIGVLLLILGGGLAVAGLGLARARAGARGPVVVGQLIAALIAWNARADAGALAWTVIVAALLVLALLASGPARAELAD